MKIIYKFHQDYLDKIKKEKNIEELSALLGYPSGQLMFTDDTKSSEQYSIDPDVFLFWMDWLIQELKNISDDNEFEFDFMDQPYYFKLLNSKFILYEYESNEVVFQADILPNRFLCEMIEMRDNIRTELLATNPSLLETKDWEYYFGDN